MMLRPCEFQVFSYIKFVSNSLLRIERKGEIGTNKLSMQPFNDTQ